MLMLKPDKNYSMHLVHLIGTAWFTVNTLSEVHVGDSQESRHVHSVVTFLLRFFFFFFKYYFIVFFISFFFTNSLFHKFYRAGCKTSAIWACKHWIFRFLAVAMVPMTVLKLKNIWKINLSNNRSCKTKPARCAKRWVNQQEFERQWRACQRCTGSLVK